MSFVRFINAVKIGDLVTVRHALNFNPEFLNQQEPPLPGNPPWSDEDTALHIAARYGFDDIVAELIRRGAQVDSRNRHDQTPLFLAAAGNHVKVADTLIRAHATVESDVRATRITPLLFAGQHAHLEMVEYLIKRGGAAPIFRGNDLAASLRAARCPEGAITEILAMRLGQPFSPTVETLLQPTANADTPIPITISLYAKMPSCRGWCAHWWYRQPPEPCTAGLISQLIRQLQEIESDIHFYDEAIFWGQIVSAGIVGILQFVKIGLHKDKDSSSTPSIVLDTVSACISAISITISGYMQKKKKEYEDVRTEMSAALGR